MRPILLVRQAAPRPGLPPLALLALVLCLALPGPAAGQGRRTITFQDLMKFRAIQSPAISEDGTIVAYALQPDRGDGEGVVHVLSTGKVYRVPRGGAPIIASDGRHVAMPVKIPFADTEKPAKDRPKPGLAILETSTGKTITIENADRLAFSHDGRWAAYFVAPPEPQKEDKEKEREKPGEASEPATLHVRDLSTGVDTKLGGATAFAFDRASNLLAYAAATGDGAGNGLYVRDLAAPGAEPLAVVEAAKGRYESLAWSREGSRLAFLAAVETKAGEAGAATLWTWDGKTRRARTVAAARQAPKGWTLPLKNEVTWSRDGRRVFFGFKPDAAEPGNRNNEKGVEPDPYDVDRLLEKVELDVWHWKDPQIQAQQRIGWNRQKDRTYRAVAHPESGRVVALADLEVPDVAVPENPRVALGTTTVPYARQATWDEGRRDAWLVDLETGKRTPIARGVLGPVVLSPDGAWAAYFHDRHWHVYDVAKGTTRNATEALGVTLYDEDHDTPGTPRAYGFGGWVGDGSSFLVYDAFDVWRIPAAGGSPENLTAGQGRAGRVRFRLVDLDRDAPSFSTREPLLLTAYHEREKNWGFYRASFDKPGVTRGLDEKKLFKFVAKAKRADVIVYTRESYEEFPDLWVADTAFARPRRISDANPQLAEFAWGSAELVTYTNLDGVELQGVLIKPADYEPGKRYPVITYIYERQSQRLYEFNEPVVNHRPSFAVYAGAGYAVFLPDIVFTPGHPGPSVVKSVVPAVQKLVDLGIADPKALGVHGHSWGGYGTAYLVTQTSLFAAAVAGAPVANMTSAYGGIRWESGVARQFQYERTQSRIGGSLWKYPERYIENSPLFYADRITTPLLIQHGDEDGAVPWYQAIELYLALRRLDKDCIFLQYRGEPHHLQKYPNKLDYSIKMKEYFDHYLKGEPPAEWIVSGRPYKGK